VQHAVVAMFERIIKEKLVTKIVEKCVSNPTKIFKIKLFCLSAAMTGNVNPALPWNVKKKIFLQNVVGPFEGFTFKSRITTFVNGQLVYNSFLRSDIRAGKKN
jgi:dihydroorotase-like cyclic amidohydrolase